MESPLPDPRNTINPETGRPIGEDRISTFTRRIPADNVSEDTDKAGAPNSEADLSTPRPRNFGDLMQVISDMLVRRLSNAGEYGVPMAEIAYEVGSLSGSISSEGYRMIDAIGELLDDSQHPLLTLDTKEFGQTTLTVLDLGMEQVFVVFGQTESDPEIAAVLPRSNHTELLTECAFRVNWFMTIEPFIIPTTIKYFEPLTERTVKQAARNAVEKWSRRHGDIQFYRDHLLAYGRDLKADDVADPEAIAALYTDLALESASEGIPVSESLWGFHPSDRYVDAINELLQHRSSSGISASSAASNNARDPEYVSGLKAVPRQQTGTFVVADINDEDWKERVMEALFD
jgi:hypothetical protein